MCWERDQVGPFLHPALLLDNPSPPSSFSPRLVPMLEVNLLGEQQIGVMGWGEKGRWKKGSSLLCSLATERHDIPSCTLYRKCIQGVFSSHACCWSALYGTFLQACWADGKQYMFCWRQDPIRLGCKRRPLGSFITLEDGTIIAEE